VKRRKLSLHLMVGVAVSLGLGGCALLPPPRAREVYVQPEAEQALSTTTLELEEISVRAGVATPRVRENTAYIYALLLGRLNVDRVASTTALPLRLVVTVSETPFVSGFETKNAVSVETRVFETLPESAPRLIAIALYSEETESTVASYRYLYDIVEKSLAEVFR
jgi:hypothetical protein